MSQPHQPHPLPPDLLQTPIYSFPLRPTLLSPIHVAPSTIVRTDLPKEPVEGLGEGEEEERQSVYTFSGFVGSPAPGPEWVRWDRIEDEDDGPGGTAALVMEVPERKGVVWVQVGVAAVVAVVVGEAVVGPVPPSDEALRVRQVGFPSSSNDGDNGGERAQAGEEEEEKGSVTRHTVHLASKLAGSDVKYAIGTSCLLHSAKAPGATLHTGDETRPYLPRGIDEHSGTAWVDVDGQVLTEHGVDGCEVWVEGVERAAGGGRGKVGWLEVVQMAERGGVGVQDEGAGTGLVLGLTLAAVGLGALMLLVGGWYAYYKRRRRRRRRRRPSRKLDVAGSRRPLSECLERATSTYPRPMTNIASTGSAQVTPFFPTPYHQSKPVPALPVHLATHATLPHPTPDNTHTQTSLSRASSFSSGTTLSHPIPSFVPRPRGGSYETSSSHYRASSRSKGARGSFDSGRSVSSLSTLTCKGPAGRGLVHDGGGSYYFLDDDDDEDDDNNNINDDDDEAYDDENHGRDTPDTHAILYGAGTNRSSSSPQPHPPHRTTPQSQPRPAFQPYQDPSTRDFGTTMFQSPPPSPPPSSYHHHHHHHHHRHHRHDHHVRHQRWHDDDSPDVGDVTFPSHSSSSPYNLSHSTPATFSFL